MLTRSGTIIFLAGVMLAGLSPAQIYRCDSGDTVVFSDQPCNDESSIHTPVRHISVITPTADLDEIAQRNQAFIRDRLDRQAAIRAARAKASRQQAEQPSQPQPAIQASTVSYLPYYVPSRRHHRQGRRHEREQSQQQAEPERQPFSALRGPFPGSRRSDHSR